MTEAGRPSKDLLRRLATAAGPPGAEGPVRRIVHETIGDLGRLEHDGLGGVVCTLEGDGPRVAVASHMDEVAFLVQSVGKDGDLALQALGGWWGHVLPAQRVRVLTADGEVPGVIGSKPPHFLRPDERERVQAVDALYVDVGASSSADVEGLGVRVGDPVVPEAAWAELAVPGVFSCKALDNRIGVGLMCETLLELAGDEGRGNVVVGIATVQEEVGARGAGAATELASPDVAIVLESTPADDTPGFTVRQAVLGRGPQVRMFDPTTVASRRLVDHVRDTAGRIDVPLQVAVRRTGGTDAQAIHVRGRGVPCVVIGVPTRYIHTHVAIARWDDYVAAARLVAEVVRGLDREAVEAIRDYREGLGRG